MSLNLGLGNRRQRKAGRLAARISLLSILAASVLTTYQYILFSNAYYTLPKDLSLGNVPVGNLSRDNALTKLYSIYSNPITVYYENESFVLKTLILHSIKARNQI